MQQPYFGVGDVRIYHGDCRDVLPQLPDGAFNVIITDPVWPNATADLAGKEDPEGLFREAAAHFPRLAPRLVVHLGCDTDPRFLRAVPAELPFFRACWLDYSVPSFKGRVLYLADVAYIFGIPPPPRKGRSLVPGRCGADGSFGQTPGHPCPRQLNHLRWLVGWFAHGPVLDPFAGIGTTLVACREQGLPAVGVEVCEAYCEAAARRLERTTATMFPPPKARRRRGGGRTLFDAPAPEAPDA